ncbi:MAG: DNA cytosine methyltransferase, partial [Planctomycetia bacterium]|nr:DNA cytosine methyltransferase [Planctomycetia bacterium]
MLPLPEEERRVGRKVESERRPVAVDLFCGAGGMSLGFEQAGFDVMLGVDLDGYHCATHERNFPYGKTLCRSVASLTRDEIFAALEGQKEVDVVFGGPPCQGFSNM